MTRMRLGRSAERIRSRRAGRALQGVSGRTPQPTTTAGTPHSPTSATVGFRSKPLLLLRRRQPDCTRDHAAGLTLDMFLDVTVPPSPPKCYHISKTLTLWAWTHSCTDSPVAILLGLIVHFLLRKVHFELGKDDDSVNANAKYENSSRRLWFYNIVCAMRTFN